MFSVDSNGRTAQSIVTSSLLHTPGFLRNTVSWIKRQLPNLDPKDLLPLGIEIVKGAIVCGNPSTPNLMVAEFQRSDGTFGVIRVTLLKPSFFMASHIPLSSPGPSMTYTSKCSPYTSSTLLYNLYTMTTTASQ